MAATDQPYRNQNTLDLVFGVSCGLMLLTTLWMFWQDYARAFKAEQRAFRDVEAAMAERDMVEKLPDPAEVAKRRDEVAKARAALQARRNELKPIERSLLAARELADEDYRNIKADFDAEVSYLNIARDEVGAYPAESPKAKSLRKTAEEKAKKVDDLAAKLAKAKAAFDAADLEYKLAIRDVLKPLEDTVAEREDDLKRLTAAFDRVAKLATQKAWTGGDAFRDLPIIDGFASPTKIHQIWLPDLTIDYGGFRDVPRYDRCMTCHMGIDKASFDRPTLAKLRDPAESERLNGKLREAQKVLQKRQDAGEDLGFNPSDLPGERGGSLWLVVLLLTGSSLVAAGSLGILEKSWRLFSRVLTLGLGLTLLTSGAIAAFSPRVTQVKTVPLTDGQVSQFCAHPRLDLFVDSNSPHPAEKFGCTTCHAGQGSATEFSLASHTPNDAAQQKAWKGTHDWESNHYWDFPMLPRRFVESSCLKCHHQVTDLIRPGGREEAPKLLRGYNLVKEMGCFGCHEIQGVKNNRWVGPDLRLEPSPALELLTAGEQERAKSDPLAPPGAMRKVGPSLRRLAEKSPQKWTRQWIHSPRGFREDTRMPHFYNLSTNSPEHLPADQQTHPATEMWAITHYLFHESNASLKGEDTYRAALLKGPRNLAALQKELAEKGLSERDWKDLLDVSRRFVDLALLSSPREHKAINAAGTRQKQLQERLRELQRSKAEQQARGGSTAAADAELTRGADELKGVTATLEALARATPISARLIDGEGNEVKLPAKAGDAAKGRVLFTERGCLACHAHEGTAKKSETMAALASDANFGPELSRIRDKLGRDGDPEAARRWLVQWVLNPNVYHPRTRMPVTHLSVEQANDVAAWLLAQPAPAWSVDDPKEPSAKEVRQLARVYLSRVGWVRDDEQDKFLPVEGDALPGIPADKMAGLPRDADERLLEAGQLTPERLLLYVGKKSIGRLGCYACHDIPGFETAKPIGVGLNDWGVKGNERLAFEDARSFAAAHFNIVQTRGPNTADLEAARAQLKAAEDKRAGLLTDAEGNKKPEADVDKVELERADRELAAARARVEALEQAKKDSDRVAELRRKRQTTGLSSAEEKELKAKAARQFFEPYAAEGRTHRPMEEAFFEAIEHHQREGFLHLKLMAPRAYDYNRRVKWDDRLRMPQFQFARTRRNAGESEAAYLARKERAEAEAREAVMTFILGLVADPVPLKYVSQPKGDRAAEVAGRHVLDKYNCASCHQLHPGQYELKATPETLAVLMQAHQTVNTNRQDMSFPNHNAWFGAAQPTPGRLRAVGFSYPEQNAALADKPGVFALRLAEALRFTGPDGLARELPTGAAAFLEMPRSALVATQPAVGGTWGDLMLPYVRARERYDAKQSAEMRSHLPPTLIREGERVQPDWLYRFLLNPTVIRPSDPDPAKSYMLLRMPKFNLSPDEARALVSYFASVSRTNNPGAGVTTPFVEVPQKDPEYWRRQTAEYQAYVEATLKALKREEDKLKKEIDELKKKAADPKGGAAAKADLTAKEEAVGKLTKVIAAIQEAVGAKLEKAPPGDYEGLYTRAAIRMMTNTNGCVTCHSIGTYAKPGERLKGPNLLLTADRIRPEWAERWIHAPSRMFSYDSVMNPLLPARAGPLEWDPEIQKLLPGDALRQVTAVRDLVMDAPRLGAMVQTVPPLTATAPAEKDKEKK